MIIVKVKELRCIDTKIGREGLRILMEALKTNTKITDLDLRSENFVIIN